MVLIIASGLAVVSTTFGTVSYGLVRSGGSKMRGEAHKQTQNNTEHDDT
jgi:hypothetical protein